MTTSQRDRRSSTTRLTTLFPLDYGSSPPVYAPLSPQAPPRPSRLCSQIAAVSCFPDEGDDATLVSPMATPRERFSRNADPLMPECTVSYAQYDSPTKTIAPSRSSAIAHSTANRSHADTGGGDDTPRTDNDNNSDTDNNSPDTPTSGHTSSSPTPSTPQTPRCAPSRPPRLREPTVPVRHARSLRSSMSTPRRGGRAGPWVAGECDGERIARRWSQGREASPFCISNAYLGFRVGICI